MVRASLAVLLWLLVGSLLYAHLEPIRETHPNDTPKTATPLTTTTNCFALLGAISPAGDLDYYSFTAPPGARVWALVDTSASTASKDSILTLFGPDGTAQIEQDDNDGVGTNCDMTVETKQSSTIAGRALTAGGIHFLRVQGSNATSLITLYKLFVVVTSSATAEVEPNNGIATATPIVTSSSPIGVRSGSIAGAGDSDYYSVETTTVGALLHVGIDADPEHRGGTGVGVDLIQSDGRVLLSLDGGENVGSPPPPALSFCFILNNTGTHFVRVRGSESSRSPKGAYRVLVAACGVHPKTRAVAQHVLPSR